MQILVLVRIDGVLPTSSFANRIEDFLQKVFQFRMPLNNMAPTFVRQCYPISPPIRNLFQRFLSTPALRNKRDHLITLSAFISVHCGIVRLICFAVLRLITNSNFVGCSTGRSAGLAPFRILSTKYATRR